MPRFTGRDTRVVTIKAPMDKVVELMSTPELLKDSIASLERHERIDDQTYRWIHEEVHEKGIRFRGDRTVRYTYDGDGTLSWTTLGEGNMATSGSAKFEPQGDDATRVEFHETIECEMEVNRLLAKLFGPIVERRLKHGVGLYLDSVRARLETTATSAAP